MALVWMIALCIGLPGSGHAEDRVADRQAIAEMTYCYAAAVDTLGNHPVVSEVPDTALAEATGKFSECLEPDAKLRLLLDGRTGPALAAGAGGPVEFAKFVRGYFTAYGYVGTLHLVGNLVVKFTGPDSAQVVSQIASTHWLRDGRMLVVPVLYEDRAVRSNSIWRIAERDIIATRFWVVEGYAPNSMDPTLRRPALK